MLSKRRSSAMDIENYLQSSSSSSSPSSLILGTGLFFKKGFGLNNWKKRGYIIKSDKKLLYYDIKTSEMKGVVDLQAVSLTRGAEENKMKCLKQFFGKEKEEKGRHEADKAEWTLQDEVLAAFSLLLITGHDMTSPGDEGSVSSATTSKKQRFELVFSTVREAKVFCFSMYSATREEPIKEFIKFECWTDLLEKIDTELDCRKSTRKLNSFSAADSPQRLGEDSKGLFSSTRQRQSSAPERMVASEGGSDTDEESVRSSESRRRSKSSDLTAVFAPLDGDVRPAGGRFNPATALLVHNGWLYKKGSHKSWQLRYFELLSSGLLTYKKNEDAEDIRGHIHLLRSEIRRFDGMSVNICTTPLLLRDGPEALLKKRTLSVSGFEIILEHEQSRSVFITFDMENKSLNEAAMERFNSALNRVKSEYDRLHVSLLGNDDNSTIRAPESAVNALNRDESSNDNSDSVGRMSDMDKTDFLNAVVLAAGSEAQPWMERLKVYSKEHKEGLIMFLFPLWLIFVLVLIRYPSTFLLFIFTGFSVAFGSLFDPYEPNR